MVEQPTLTIPEGFTLHTENNSHILLPSSNEAFVNPVQEFNRDISVACIRVWGEELNRAKRAKWEQNQERKRKRPKDAPSGLAQDTNLGGSSTAVSHSKAGTLLSAQAEYRPYKFALLEALSATGLRSIRYAKEIPLVRHVTANDLSPSAVEAMRRNFEFNGLLSSSETEGMSTEPENEVRQQKSQQVKVTISESDACALMYKHREERNRVDVVDLDPYGTAAPFIDAAVQCVNDGGLLCVTCTDLAVLATNNHPEKCFTNYGGIPVKAEYCHEAALRLVLLTISTSAGRYGRYIQPLLSLSVDFYVRLFVRVQSAPIEVKKTVSMMSMFYICVGCQAFYEQPLGRMVEKVHALSGNLNLVFKTQPGPPVSHKCTECNSPLHLAGPMWSGPLHDVEFVGKVLEHLERDGVKYGTLTRMKGVLTVAKEELDVPFFFTPSKIASFFHCTSPSLDNIASALLHAGHQISRSHISPGSLKTTATRKDIHDVYRSWVKLNPVRMDNLGEGSPARQLLAKEPSFIANFERHPQSVTPSSKVKLVRYQQNPAPFWGPGSRAAAGKRKREED